MDILDRAVDQLNGAFKLKSRLVQCLEENTSLLSEKYADQKIIAIDLQKTK